MHTIFARNVNDALAAGLTYLAAEGVREDSRNGPVLVAPGPVVTVYSHPLERVLFSPTRDANPFFHLFESLWMLAGRNDLAYLTQFVKTFGAFSDDGKTLRGAYGHRWRNWFGYDQLEAAINELRFNPGSRRVVVTMWDAGKIGYPESYQLAYPDAPDEYGDLLATSKDKPCNTHIYFDLRGGVLNMTVLNRSNDIWLGAYGANAVHMSFLQEYVANKLGKPVGEYRQFSNNYHLYENDVPAAKREAVIKECGLYDFYANNSFAPVPLRANGLFDRDLPVFLNDVYDESVTHPFLTGVARPMYTTWSSRLTAESLNVTDAGWGIAADAWVTRRKK